VKNWRDEDLVLHLYGEHPRREELARAIVEDPELASRFAALARELAPYDHLEVRETDDQFEAQQWNRLRPRLAATPGGAWRTLFAPGPGWRLAALATLLVAALATAFWAGRRTAEPLDASPTIATRDAGALEPAARERLLLASVAGHLESSGLLLTDLANAPADGRLDEERRWATTLLASNRLYRQAAQRAGQRRIVALLDELEPLLVELAHHPDESELTDLQHRIRERDLLFKVRSVGGKLGAGREYPEARFEPRSATRTSLEL